jgi:hypothetical protein
MYTGFYSVCPVLISGKNGLAESSLLVNGLSADDIVSIVPSVSKEEVLRVRYGHTLSVKFLQKFSLGEIYNSKL